MDVVVGLPTSGLSILVSTSATPWVTHPQLDTKGLTGVSGLWILESPQNLGALQPIGYMALHVLLSNPV